MANKANSTRQHKKAAARKASRQTPAATLLKGWLWLSYIVLAWLFYTHGSLPITGGIILVSLILSLLYGFTHREFIMGTVQGEKIGRFLVSYFITLTTVFFYALAMIRSNQMSDIVRGIIIVASLLVMYCVYLSLKGILTRRK